MQQGAASATDKRGSSPVRADIGFVVPIFTFVTDEQEYAEMRASFEEAGFTDRFATRGAAFRSLPPRRTARSRARVDFHVHHLSSGRRTSAYLTAVRSFEARWNREFRARYFRSSTDVHFFSRSRPLRHMLGATKLRRVLKKYHRLLGQAATVSLSWVDRPDPRTRPADTAHSAKRFARDIV